MRANTFFRRVARTSERLGFVAGILAMLFLGLSLILGVIDSKKP